MVLIGQGYQANIASGKYKIDAIIKLRNPQQNLMMVYLPSKQAQAFNSSPNLVSAYMLNVKDASQTPIISAELKKALGENFEVMDWKDMTPEIGNNIKIDTAIFTLIASALYIIVGFGIIGTIIMMALERKKEFGMLQANGMQKSKIQNPNTYFNRSIVFGIVRCSTCIQHRNSICKFHAQQPNITYW